MRVVLAERAKRDVDRAYVFLADHSPNAGRKFAIRVRAALRRLRDFPELGPVVTELEPAGRYRHLVVGVHRVIYRIDGDVLSVVRIWDGRRNPEELKVG